MDSPKRTKIRELGEFGLIEQIKKGVVIHHGSTLTGIGDDAAVVDGGLHYKKLISTDMLLEGIHFDLSYMPLTHLGYKAVTVNVSDIAAMNGIPKQMTISLGLSNRMSIEAVEALYEGIYAAAKDYQVDIVGGDTTSSRSGLVISITLIGESKPDNIIYRNGAKEGDIICLSGDIGGAYMGLQILEREKEVFKSDPNTDDKDLDIDNILDQLVICGDANQVVDQILALREEVGDFGELLYGGVDWLDKGLARKSMELMAEKVIPEVTKNINK